MRRLFWLAMGVTIGALVVRRLTKTAERLTPKGLAQSVAESVSKAAEAVKSFADDARAASQEREAELKEAAGIDATGTPPKADTGN